ncbi:MAG: hypothetical protein OHK0012_03530 [Synechococcales cyanobacterium]
MRQDDSLRQVGGVGVGLLFCGGIAFAVLRALRVPVGEFTDWLIAIACFWWLLVIVTIPWNIYFVSQGLLRETERSVHNGIPVEVATRRYVERLHRWSLRVALGLHGMTALAFYGLAAYQVTSLGYLTSLAALLLTGVRPALRAYEYLADRLQQIGQEILVPREDAVVLAAQVRRLDGQITQCLQALDPTIEGSWAAKNQADQTYLRQELARLQARLEQEQASNALDHDRLAREAHQAIAQLTVDSQFLSHVREIIRFFKET